MLGAGIAHATDRVEIVVDVSASMWSVLQDGTPRVVAVREALEDLAMTLGATRGGPEVGREGNRYRCLKYTYRSKYPTSYP